MGNKEILGLATTGMALGTAGYVYSKLKRKKKRRTSIGNLVGAGVGGIVGAEMTKATADAVAGL